MQDPIRISVFWKVITHLLQVVTVCGHFVARQGTEADIKFHMRVSCQSVLLQIICGLDFYLCGIFLDVNMPILHSYQSAQLLWQRDPWRNPVLGVFNSRMLLCNNIFFSQEAGGSNRLWSLIWSEIYNSGCFLLKSQLPISNDGGVWAISKFMVRDPCLSVSQYSKRSL